MIGWDGWMASQTWWTWIWVNFRSLWWTGGPDMLQSMGSQRVRHDWETELNWTELNWTRLVWVIQGSRLTMHMFAREMPGREYGEGAREGWEMHQVPWSAWPGVKGRRREGKWKSINCHRVEGGLGNHWGDLTLKHQSEKPLVFRDGCALDAMETALGGRASHCDGFWSQQLALSSISTWTCRTARRVLTIAILSSSLNSLSLACFIKKQRHHFADKCSHSQSYDFSSTHVRMTIKKAEGWRIDAFELWCLRRLSRVSGMWDKTSQS